MENKFITQPIKKDSYKIVLKVIKKFLKFTLKNSLFALVIFFYYFFKSLRMITESFEHVIEAVCIKLELVRILDTPEVETQKTERAFTDEELKIMAGKIVTPYITLKDIADKYNISMRQARKVKDVLSGPVINGNSA